MNVPELSKIKELSDQEKDSVVVIKDGKVTIVELPKYGQVVIRSQGNKPVKISNTTESLLK